MKCTKLGDIRIGSRTNIKLSTNIDVFAQHLGSHHYAIVYKDLIENLDLFCRIKKIKLMSEVQDN